MKFSLFVHMERYDASTSHRQLFDELTELVQMAERGGFETAWVGEHHAMEFTIAPNPFINLAYLAARTERIRLGTGTVIAPFWHPIRLAGEAGMVDVASNGRLDLGIARGAYSFEYERLLPGLDAFGAGARMRELVPALRSSSRVTTPTTTSSGSGRRLPRCRARFSNPSRRCGSLRVTRIRMTSRWRTAAMCR